MTNILLLFHHVAVTIIMIPAGSARTSIIPDTILFLGAAGYMLEISAIFLNFRLLGKIGRHKTVYFVG